MKNYNDIYDAKQEMCTMMDTAYSKGYDKAYKDRQIEEQFDEDRVIAIEEAYQKGLDDAWECANRIVAQPSDGGFSITQLGLIFSQASVASVLSKYSASEAIDKIKEYEYKEKKKADDEIKVGDEVMVDERRMLVLGVDSGGWKQLWCPSSGLVYDNIATSEMTKTGKHLTIFDQIKDEQ